MKQNMSSIEIRSKFLEFFGNNGHTIVPSSSLIPKDDDSVLFTTAGMQQFKDYYTDKKDAQSDFHSKNTVSIQKCIRTSDIDEVGDSSHLTFFEMFGNFSFGGYYKENAIKYAYEFITREMALDISYITVFKGLENSPIKKDEESIKVWKSLGIKDIREEGMEDVFWGPTGSSGPCGPTTEIYCKDNKGKDLEIWNIVFNEFYCYGSREQLLESPQTVRLESLSFKGIDTGMGLERLVMIIQKVDNIYDTDIFKPAMNKIKENSDKWDIKGARIIADHIRASTSLIEDGVIPSNTDRGYILRRLLRRAIRYAKTINLKIDLIELVDNDKVEIKEEIRKEIERFEKTLETGLREFEKGRDAFVLYSSYGFPLELAMELAKEKGISIDVDKFNEEMKKHQELSRSGALQKFKGGLADADDPIIIKYHTATHLLHQALCDVLGDGITQKGSNITKERLRFDFSFDRKMTDEEKVKVEDIVNNKIRENLYVKNIVMSRDEAEKIGAKHFFGDKYGDEISIYYIGDTLENAYSKEFCGGPHVGNTGEIGKFKIQKEEAVAGGIRRIKAVLQ